ncbi:MAG: GumC family protein [Clostridiales bacterium]
MGSIDNTQIQGRNKHKFSDYLYILYKWRYFLIIWMTIVLIAATVFAFMLPEKYKATAVVMIPPENTMGLGGLSSLLSGKSSSMGTKLFGVSGSSEDMLVGILGSRTANVEVVKHFHLMDYYEMPNMDRTLRAFSEDVEFGPNDQGMIEVSVINKDRNKSAQIANFFIEVLDSLNIKYNVEQAYNNRVFLEKRYQKNVADLRRAEDSLYRYQKKYGVFSVPEQMEAAVKSAAEIESQLAQVEVVAQMAKGQYGENSPHYQGYKQQISMLKNKINELKNSSNLSETSNVLFPFKKAPDMAIQYLRLFREIEVQQKIMEVLLPMYEQTRFEEQKSIPAVTVLDKAVPPALKDSPKRAFIIVGIGFVAFFILLVFVFRGEEAVNRTEFFNPLETKETDFVKKIASVFRVKH